MRKLLNTVYVTTDGAWIHKDGANVVMSVEGQERARLPAHMLSGLVCFGRVSVSTPLLGYCAEQGICVTYLNPNGRFLARVEGPVSGNVLLRREQYRASDDPQRCASITRHLLAGKIGNQRTVLARGLRDHGERLPEPTRRGLDHAVRRLDRLIGSLWEESSMDVLRGIEGEAAQAYFGCFGALVRSEDTAFEFRGRSRRPPRDAINTLLSFLYTLLTHDCRSALETVGLDPAVGFLHRDRPGRPSLALDLIEEFRPVIADRLALSLVNRRQLSGRDFRFVDGGAVTMTEDARKQVITAYQERKREELLHPFVQEKAMIGLFPLVQAQLMTRHLRGDLDGYPPFVWR